MSSGGRGRLRLELDIVLDDDNDFGLEDCARLRVDRQKGVLRVKYVLKTELRLSGLLRTTFNLLSESLKLHNGPVLTFDNYLRGSTADCSALYLMLVYSRPTSCDFCSAASL